MRKQKLQERGKWVGRQRQPKRQMCRGVPQIEHSGVQDGRGDCHAPGSWPANPHSQPLVGCKGMKFWSFLPDIPGENRHQAKATATEVPKSQQQASGRPWLLESSHSLASGLWLPRPGDLPHEPPDAGSALCPRCAHTSAWHVPPLINLAGPYRSSAHWLLPPLPSRPPTRRPPPPPPLP